MKKLWISAKEKNQIAIDWKRVIAIENRFTIKAKKEFEIRSADVIPSIETILFKGS